MGTALPKVAANYGDGFSNQILVRGVPIFQSNPGEVFWVDENASHTGRGTFQAPDTTIDNAYNRCVADRGDVVCVKPSHTESGTGTNFVVMDTAGVTIVGLGQGDDQAAMTFATSADSCYITVSAANNAIVGMRFQNLIDDLDGAIRIAAGGDYFSMENCWIHANLTSGYETFITLAAGANYFSFNRNLVEMPGDDDGESLVKAAGTSYGFICIGNNIVMAATAAIFDIDAGAITGPVIFRDNFMANTEGTTGLCVAIAAATVGHFIGERYRSGKANVVPASNLAASVIIDCWGTDAVATQSIQWPAATPAWS